MENPRFNTPNPDRNRVLTMLKKRQVDLLAIPLERYVRDGGVEAMVDEAVKLLNDQPAQYRDFADVDEFSPSHIFGSLIPFWIILKGEALAVFIPDHMTEDDLATFHASIKREAIPLAKLRATKTGRLWLYERV